MALAQRILIQQDGVRTRTRTTTRRFPTTTPSTPNTIRPVQLAANHCGTRITKTYTSTSTTSVLTTPNSLHHSPLKALHPTKSRSDHSSKLWRHRTENVLLWQHRTSNEVGGSNLSYIVRWVNGYPLRAKKCSFGHMFIGI